MSIEINLLPWREREREQRTRRFQRGVLLALLLGLVAGGLIALHQQALVRAEQARLGMIERHTQQLTRDIESVRDFRRLRQRMLEQIDLIGTLQASRPLTVEVFDQLTATLVDGVHYTKLVRDDHTLELDGIAASNRQVSEQMRRLAASPVLGVPLLSDVSAGDGADAPRRFQMSVEEQPATDATHAPAASAP
ncbi:PilN domain-containing protein [Salinicola endophyticus]|uniref:PilN domain-containing protein n=1 Tax=Salinicola endophyticus TaxID=1949083 RepID=A0AB74UBK0_9GAMM